MDYKELAEAATKMNYKELAEAATKKEIHDLRVKATQGLIAEKKMFTERYTNEIEHNAKSMTEVETCDNASHLVRWARLGKDSR